MEGETAFAYYRLVAYPEAAMNIKEIFAQYEMDAVARGYTSKTISHTEASVRYFVQYLGGVEDISKVTGDDFRRFLVDLRGRNTWEGLSFEKERKLSGNTINTYSRAIKASLFGTC